MYSNKRKTGDLGGYVESYNNLNQEGDCWVFDNAKVFGSANISEDARVYGEALVYGSAWVYGTTQLFEHYDVITS